MREPKFTTQSHREGKSGQHEKPLEEAEKTWTTPGTEELLSLGFLWNCWTWYLKNPYTQEQVKNLTWRVFIYCSVWRNTKNSLAAIARSSFLARESSIIVWKAIWVYSCTLAFTSYLPFSFVPYFFFKIFSTLLPSLPDVKRKLEKMYFYL